MTTAILSLSGLSSDIDDQSDGGFEFAHPLFANSTTPRRGSRLLVRGGQARTSPNFDDAHAEHKVAFVTPSQTIMTRFGRRQPLGNRTFSNDGLATETPGQTTHLSHKTGASAPRWKRIGRIGLGPPKRTERQSLEPENAPADPAEHSDGLVDKENQPPETREKATSPLHGNSKPNRESFQMPRLSSSPTNLSRHSTAGHIRENHESSRPGSASSDRAHPVELSASSQRPFSLNKERPAVGRHSSSNSSLHTEHDIAQSKNRSTSSTRSGDLNKSPVEPETPGEQLQMSKPGPILNLQAQALVAGTTERPLPVLQLGNKAVSAGRDDAQAPPPKMTLESNASTAARKAKVLGKIVMNGREYTKLDQIGKGGSSKVFRVMAPNGRIFALKRVDFEQADQATILGYKSEIDLLRKLSNSTGCERIIKLFDSEINDSKGRLLMLMEAGEIDLAHMLTKRSAEVPDFNFIRLFWRHMLEAVQAVHDEKIVHSDLKPANFLLVEGSLKLIDFGIAKAIGNDTTNIHRDQQVGTINYMSPEALSDTGAGGARVMKLGRASDVWSLGCILYQMVYGRTPFAHLSMIQKIQAIPSDTHRIEFPARAYPSSMANDTVKDDSRSRLVEGDILRVLRGCLERDQRQRLTIEQLLKDPFLRPEERAQRTTKTDSVAVNLAQITELLRLTVAQTREKTLKKENIQSADIEYLAKDFYDRLRWAV